jgi:hypothetical protein
MGFKPFSKTKADFVAGRRPYLTPSFPTFVVTFLVVPVRSDEHPILD